MKIWVSKIFIHFWEHYNMTFEWTLFISSLSENTMRIFGENHPHNEKGNIGWSFQWIKLSGKSIILDVTTRFPMYRMRLWHHILDSFGRLFFVASTRVNTMVLDLFSNSSSLVLSSMKGRSTFPKNLVFYINQPFDQSHLYGKEYIQEILINASNV